MHKFHDHCMRLGGSVALVLSFTQINRMYNRFIMLLLVHISSYMVSCQIFLLFSMMSIMHVLFVIVT